MTLDFMECFFLGFCPGRTALLLDYEYRFRILKTSLELSSTQHKVSWNHQDSVAHPVQPRDPCTISKHLHCAERNITKTKALTY